VTQAVRAAAEAVHAARAARAVQEDIGTTEI
jgi:hypothetical protein